MFYSTWQHIGFLSIVRNGCRLRNHLEQNQSRKISKSRPTSSKWNYRVARFAPEYVTHFCSLGLTLSGFDICYTERARKRLVGRTAIEKPSLLFLNTATRVFGIKLRPMGSCGLELIWKELSWTDWTAYSLLFLGQHWANLQPTIYSTCIC